MRGTDLENLAGTTSPLLLGKRYDEVSVFQPDALLREARRQKDLPFHSVPPVCILDPDGDIVRRLRRTGAARLSQGWACYHTELLEFEMGSRLFGIVGCAVGSSFAVLVAEQLFASGCRFLISITSAGQILEAGPPPYFVVIERALRDEGTSHHYLPPAAFAAADQAVVAKAEEALRQIGISAHRGATWTTDAPFRETASAIAVARGQGILAVEMEAAALYAFSRSQQKPVICFAHVTNSMGQVHGDFEKGEAEGTADALKLIEAVAEACR
jgi:uridine phosphorylase